jgi:hypothetical protein
MVSREMKRQQRDSRGQKGGQQDRRHRNVHLHGYQYKYCLVMCWRASLTIRVLGRGNRNCQRVALPRKSLLSVFCSSWSQDMRRRWQPRITFNGVSRFHYSAKSKRFRASSEAFTTMKHVPFRIAERVTSRRRRPKSSMSIGSAGKGGAVHQVVCSKIYSPVGNAFQGWPGRGRRFAGIV